MLQPPARDQRVRLDQRLDHRIVGVAELALVVDDALTSQIRRSLVNIGHMLDSIRYHVFIKRLSRNSWELPVLGLTSRLLVIRKSRSRRAMARRRVNEASSGILGHVVASK